MVMAAAVSGGGARERRQDWRAWRQSSADGANDDGNDGNDCIDGSGIDKNSSRAIYAATEEA